jgi:tellurite resistance protein TehA-like permease
VRRDQDRERIDPRPRRVERLGYRALKEGLRRPARARHFAQWVDDVPLGAGAFVMATGIISVGLHLVDSDVPSAIFFAVATAAWLGLAAIFFDRALRKPARFRREARSPAVLTAVAGTATLGQRLLEFGPSTAADTALGLSVCLCLALLPGAARVRERAAGTAFLLVVSIESLAVLAASCARVQQAVWLAIAALVLFLAGLAAYGWIMVNLDLRALARSAGDQWIAGGALAISALACAQLADAAGALVEHGSLRAPLADTALALLIAAFVWLPVLVVDELLSPRLRYDIRRWSTVFPLGMYAVSSVAVGQAVPAHAFVAFARVWIWIAFAAWLATALGAFRRTGGTHTVRDPEGGR